MRFTHTYKIRGGRQELYAVGHREGIIQALRDTFIKHQMPIHKEKNQTFYHFPSGWIDRIAAGMAKVQYYAGAPDADHFSVEYSSTNNPLVTRVLINLYHKTLLFRGKKAEERIRRFYSALAYEFDAFQIPLIEAEHWPDVIDHHPELHCSPTWDISRQLRTTELERQKMECRNRVIARGIADSSNVDERITKLDLATFKEIAHDLPLLSRVHFKQM